MKIKGVKINGFGNLIDKEIEFKDGINLIKGHNESGKSTIMGFLNSVFFGIQRTRKRDVISDDVRYKPWNSSEFSGFLQYELDNNEKYTVFRDFDKKKVSILDGKNNDITSKYGVDKESGSIFLEEQTGIDKTSFALSSYTMQNSVVLNSTDKNQMVQKLSNLMTTGEDNISYKKLEKKIQDKRREEVGSQRTISMPINKVHKRIAAVKHEIKTIKDKNSSSNNVSDEEKEAREEFKNLEFKRKLLLDLKSNVIKLETGIDMISSLKEKVRVKQDEIRDKLNQKHDIIEKDSIIEKNSKMYLGITVIAVILEILVSLLIKFVFKTEDSMRIIYSLIPVPVIAILATLFVTFKEKINIDSEYEQQAEENREIEREITLLRKDVMTQEKEIAKFEKLKQVDEGRFKKELIAEFCGNVEDQYLNGILACNIEKLKEEEKRIESEYTKALYRLSTLDAKKVIANKDVEKLVGLEERLNSLEQEKSELDDLNEVYEIVLAGLEEAYVEMKDSISPSFVRNLSEAVKKITNGKYRSVVLSEDQKIMVQLPTGEYIELEKLSTGTIEQVNFALRMSILKELTDEKLPILLDETFVFYDENRLKNVLEYITKEEGRQVLLFTCSDREKTLLDQDNVEYNYIEMR